jgi:hypothetical protein
VSLPPFLLGSALLFWGWHTGLWWLGLPLALLAELPRFLRSRWELELRERQRVADLVSLLILLTAVYLSLTQPRPGSALILLVQWLPALLFPVLALQLYGERDGVERSVLMLSLRGGQPRGAELLDLGPAFLLVCLLASAMLPPPGSHYYPLLALLAAWALWPCRPRRGQLWVWGVALLLAAAAGHALGIGLQRAQGGLEDLAVAWLSRWLASDLDPYRVTTAIGEVGSLKRSERIVLRVHPDRPPPRPLLLREATYQRYVEGTWLADATPFASLALEANGWRLPGDATAPRREVRVLVDLRKDRGILPLPEGSRRIGGLQGAQLSRNASGTVKVLEGPAAADYRVDYGGPAAAAPPGELDLRIPPNERPALARVVDELDLAGLSAAEALERLDHWFDRSFGYSLRLEGPPPGRTALSHFLLERRAGHCEYFASAAVLLLRQAGIPARYVRGWSVQEHSALEGAYVARARHAHAWASAWVSGAWRDFDPTPPDWSALEAERRPWWTPVQDLWARFIFVLTRGEAAPIAGLAGGALLLPLAALLVWRVGRRGRRRSGPRARACQSVGAESPFAPVERVMTRRGGGRAPGVTLRSWLGRLEREGEGAAAELRPAVDLYYRQRFDPGADPEESGEVRRLIDAWLRRHGSGTG